MHGEQKIARAYVIYREERSRERAAEAATNPSQKQETTSSKSMLNNWMVKKRRSMKHVYALLLLRPVKVFLRLMQSIIQDSLNNLFDGIDRGRRW